MTKTNGERAARPNVRRARHSNVPALIELAAVLTPSDFLFARDGIAADSTP